MLFNRKPKRLNPSILTLADATLGVCLTGRPGSGKSTGLRILLEDLADQGGKICIACIKADEADIWQKILPDAVRFTPESHKFNPYTYEMTRKGGSASNLATFHDDLNEVLTRADSQKQEMFWKGGAHDCLTYAFELAFLVRGEDATYEDVYQIIMTCLLYTSPSPRD